MFSFSLQSWVVFFQAHPHFGGVIAFFVVFIEALAVIGTIVPGSITMTALGFLIGSATISAGSAFFCAFLGAISGDYISYLVGVYYKDRIHQLRTFRKHPQLLERSEKFFRYHGGKSIFLGRFLGVLRAMIPLVAGMLRMRQLPFLLAAIPSALLWVAVYLFPGILLGALSLELPPKAATTFTLGVLAFVVAVWLVVWLLQHFFLRISRLVDAQIAKLWQFMRHNVVARWITELLVDPTKPEDHSQLTLVIFAALFGLLFFVLVINIIGKSSVTGFNYPFLHLLQSLRLSWLDQLMVGITLLGDEITIWIASLLFLGWLVWKRYWYIAVHWIAVVVLSSVTVLDFKKIVYMPRPEGIAAIVHGSSFPSGHAALSIAIFGFLALIIARELPKEKKIIPFIIVGIVTFVIGFSRLYLGAHWLTDILGSFLAGITILFLVAISYRRRPPQHLPLNSFLIAIFCFFIVTWVGHGMISYHKQLKGFSHVWVPQRIAMSVWQQPSLASIPLFRFNRLGHPIEAFNIRWLGELNIIRQQLLQQGWQEQPVKLDLQGIIRVFATSSVYHHFPLLPQLYHDKPPELLLIKATDKDDAILILRLWQSGYVVDNQTLPLWIGTVEYHTASPRVFTLRKHKEVFVGATDHLVNFLTGFKWQQVTFSVEKQPAEIQTLQWDGKLLLIESKNG